MNTDFLNTPFPKPDAYGSLNFPVYQTAAYEFESAEAMEAAFTGRSKEHTYSRISNPTVEYFEERVRNITQAFSVTALNSGMAAISHTMITLAQSGSNIVASPHLFGNTYSLLKSTLKDFGIEARFCDFTRPDEIEELIDSNTCALYCEIISNPQMEVVDLEKIAAVAKRKNVPLVVDTTIIPFCSFSAKERGVDIEIISSTKYISGGATSLGGLIVDYGKFDYSFLPKFSAHSDKAGRAAFSLKLKKEIHRNLGAYMNPQTAYLQNLGLETLSLRYAKAVENALQTAQQLEKIPAVVSVNYPGLASNPFYELSCRQFGKFAGAMFTFELSSRQDCFRFLNRLKLIKRATNLFDNKTLAIHPASTIYGTFTEDERERMGISQKIIRISAGLENPEALLSDISQALN